jgi:hypothetical protein
MSPASNTLLSLILVALGCLGVTLSFMVPDRKKSLISLGLAIAIIAVGLLQWGTQSIARFQLERRMREIQRDRQVDLDAMREKLKEQAQPAPKKS